MSEYASKEKEALKHNLLARIVILQTNFKGGIPEEEKHSTSPDSGWKVQKGVWFQQVTNVVGKVMAKIHDGVLNLSNDFFEEIKEYYDDITADDTGFKSRLTTQDDIDKAEAILDKIKTELEK